MSSFGNIAQDPRYVLPGGAGYQSGAGELYNQEHFFDPESGGVMGPLGAPPHTAFPLQWQTAHEQAVERARSLLGRGATDYLRGALGNLQSFRPGGHAAMASGVYGQLAQSLLSRASMLRPVDLLSDFRREAEFQANRAGSWKNKIRNWTGAAQSVIGVFTGAAQAGAGVAGMFAGAPGASGTPGAAMGQPGGMGALSPQAGAGFMQLGQAGMGGTTGPGMGGAGASGAIGSSYTQPGYQQQMQQTFGQQRQGQPAPGPGGPGAAPGPGGQQQRRGGGGEEGGPGAQAQPGGGAMAGGGGFGSNGDFGPLAMAMQGAGQAGPMGPVRDAIMSTLMVDRLQGDPDFAAIDYAISRAAALRGMAA